jgi:hypothetical protein
VTEMRRSRPRRSVTAEVRGTGEASDMHVS